MFNLFYSTRGGSWENLVYVEEGGAFHILYNGRSPGDHYWVSSSPVQLFNLHASSRIPTSPPLSHQPGEKSCPLSTDSPSPSHPLEGGDTDCIEKNSCPYDPYPTSPSHPLGEDRDRLYELSTLSEVTREMWSQSCLKQCPAVPLHLAYPLMSSPHNW